MVFRYIWDGPKGGVGPQTPHLPSKYSGEAHQVL